MMISFFAVIIGYIVTLKMNTLVENLDIQNYEMKLHSNITEKADLSIGYDTSLNTNGGGFTDTLTCPSAVTMSGTLAGGVLETIPTVPFFDGTTFVCSGSTLGGNLLLYYSTGGNIFTSGKYLGLSMDLQPIDGIGARTGTFSDGSGTYLSFTATGTFSGLDLDGNSDNFLASSTGTIMYPSGQSNDDDDMARRTIFGYIKKNIGWYNSFIMNTPVRKYIASNTSNIGFNVALAGATQTGYLRMDMDNSYSMKISEFSTAIFDSTKEFRTQSGVTTTFSTGGIGWVMPDLSLS